MALVLKDRISETTSTAGTGAITLAGATSGFVAFSTIGNGNTTYYCITDGAAWEVGLGTYTSSGNTLARTTVYSNSNGNTTPITLSGGIKNVFGVLPADGIITVSGTSIQVPGTAVLSVANGGTGSNTATFSGENITSINANNVSTGVLAVAQGGTGSSTATFSGANITSLNASSVSTGTLGVARGGTGAATLDANNVILGNGTSAVQFVAPGTSSNVLTSNGTTWVSQAAGGGTQDFDLVVDYSFSSQSYSQFDITSLPTTNGWYAMVGRVFMSSDTQAVSMAFRCSTDNGSSFYSGSGNYWRTTTSSTAPNLFSDLNRSGANPGLIAFSYYYYQPSAFNNADLFTLQGAATATYLNPVGGFGTTFLFLSAGLLVSNNPVNALRFLRTTGTATFTDGFVKIYKLAMS